MRDSKQPFIPKESCGIRCADILVGGRARMFQISREDNFGIFYSRHTLNLVADVEFDQVVTEYYAVLYRFALSLTRNESESLDLTQQTFYLWATKGWQLRNASKLKSWLCTTLYREFLRLRRHSQNYPHVDISLMESELPAIEPQVIEKMDADSIMEALLDVDEVYRAPLTLFYTEARSYQEISNILGIPAGTVMSRLARGKEQLRRRILEKAPCSK